MPKNTRDIRTLAYVLRRTNYGEADRIINFITPSGKISAIARSVRKEKSKLAGGVEMFSRLDLNIHHRQSEMGIITGAKMLQFFGNILKNYDTMEYAGKVLKTVSQLSESSDTPEYYHIVDQVMQALDDGVDLNIVKTWTNFNIKRASGEEINLYRDALGDKLDANKKYRWDYYEKSLLADNNGDISANEIKLMRLILTNKLSTVAKIKNIGDLISPILKIADNI